VIAVIVVSVVCGVVANELCEFSPWCAGKLVRWSAFRRYADPERAEIRAEELTALINERPGNLFKLFTAVGFAGTAFIISARRAIARESDAAPAPVPVPVLTPVSHTEVLDRIYWYLDGEMSHDDCESIRQHVDECGPCLREYGLEEAVKRLVDKHCGSNPNPRELRAHVVTRIRQVQAEINDKADSSNVGIRRV
jgi:mycothiol system anti-sigma-R factor